MLLRRIDTALGKDNVHNGFFGQEINLTTYNLARINMFLHEINFSDFDIAHGDTLIDPQHWDYQPFEAIVSNPPYIKTSVISGLQEEVRLHDPFLALDGKEDGLFFYRELLKGAPAYLNRGAVVLFEIGCDQGVDVSDLMKRMNMIEVQIIKDYAGLDRVVSGVFLE